jgi:hypothetical protein
MRGGKKSWKKFPITLFEKGLGDLSIEFKLRKINSTSEKLPGFWWRKKKKIKWPHKKNSAFLANIFSSKLYTCKEKIRRKLFKCLMLRNTDTDYTLGAVYTLGAHCTYCIMQPPTVYILSLQVKKRPTGGIALPAFILGAGVVTYNKSRKHVMR